MKSLTDEIERAVEAANWPTPAAHRSGRKPERPYVAVLRHTGDDGTTCTEVIRGFAYATLDEAIENAAACVAARKDALRRRLADPHAESLREQYGLTQSL